MRQGENAVFKGEGKGFLLGVLICRYTLSEYISDIYVDGLSILSAKNLIMKSRDFVRLYLFNAGCDDVTGWTDRRTQWLTLR